MEEQKEDFTVVWMFHDNICEEFDDEENFCGHKTKTTIEIDSGLTAADVIKRYDYITEIAASYGDGITFGKVLAIFDTKTKESFPIEHRYWKQEEDLYN